MRSRTTKKIIITPCSLLSNEVAGVTGESIGNVNEGNITQTLYDSYSSDPSNLLEPKSIESCKHCGLKLQGYQVEFCCPGCRSIYRLINDLGLNKVYEMPGSLPTGGYVATKIHYEALKTLDDLGVDVGDGECGNSCEPFRSTTLQVEGMTCNACVWLLEGLSSKISGLVSVRVNLSRGEVALVYDRQQVLPSDVALLIESLGYQVILGGSRPAITSRSSSELLTRVAFAGYCAMNIMLFSLACYGGYFEGIEFGFNQLFRWLSFLLTLPVVIYCAQPIWSRAFNALRMGMIHLDIPICLGTGLTFIISTINLIRGDEEIYFDSISGLVFLLLSGRWLQGRMLQSATQGADRLSSLLGGYARRISSSEGKDVQEIVAICEVRKNDILLVESGERSCVDGISEVDEAEVDRSFLTGESKPVILKKGDKIFAGDLNLAKLLRVKADAGARASGLAALIGGISSRHTAEKCNLNNSSNDESSNETKYAELASKGQLTDRGLSDTIAPYFTVAILTLSLLSLIWWLPQGVYTALSVMVALLIVACPCAFGVALPAIEAIATAKAYKLGILVKRIETLERLSKLRVVVFDKTGTLTVNHPHVIDIVNLTPDVEDSSLGMLTYKGSKNTPRLSVNVLRAIKTSSRVTPWHPISSALTEYISHLTSDRDNSEEIDDLVKLASHAKYEAGAGVSLFIDGKEWRIGSINWALFNSCEQDESCDIAPPRGRGVEQSALQTHQSTKASLLRCLPERYRANPIVVVSECGNPRVLFVLSQEPRRGISTALRYLSEAGLELHLLSGDRNESVREFVESIGVAFRSILGEQSPTQKLGFVEKHGCIMVGDGINDAAALEAADVGIAVSGGIGTTFKAGDIYLLNPDGATLVSLFKGAANVRRAVRLCFVVSLAYNVIGVSLAISGVLSPLIAALMMPISSLSMLLIALIHPSFSEERKV